MIECERSRKRQKIEYENLIGMGSKFQDVMYKYIEIGQYSKIKKRN